MVGVPRSQRLLAYQSVAAEHSPFWKCPDGYVTLVKSFTAINAGTATYHVELNVSDATGVLILPIVYMELAPLTPFQWTGWDVLNPGDFIRAYLGGAGVRVWLSGAVLAGPPQFPPATRLLNQATPLPAGVSDGPAFG